MNSPEEGDGVPVLTQIVEDRAVAPPTAADAGGADADALADQLERALLERLGPEVDRVTARALDKVRAELATSVLQMVRDAVAASLARSRGVPRRD
jgi:hypothetical protein